MTTTLRQSETELLVRILTAQADGTTTKHWCYEDQGFAIVTKIDGELHVKMPKVCKPSVLTLTETVNAIVNAHQGE